MVRFTVDRFMSSSVSPFRNSSRKITRSEKPGAMRNPIRADSSSITAPTARLFRLSSIEIRLRSTTQSVGARPSAARRWRAFQTSSA